MSKFRIFCNLRVLSGDRRGAVTLDYAVVGSGIVVAALVAITSLGGGLDRRFTQIGEFVAVPATAPAAGERAVPAATAPLPGGGPSQGIHGGGGTSPGGAGTGSTAPATTAGTTTTGTTTSGAGSGSGGTSGSASTTQTATSGGAGTTGGTTTGGTTGGGASSGGSGSGTTAGTPPRNCRTVGNGRNARVVCEDDDDD